MYLIERNERLSGKGLTEMAKKLTKKQLVENFCEALSSSGLGPFETAVYEEAVFIDGVTDEEIKTLIRELKRLA
jgi:hypothetical protein